MLHDKAVLRLSVLLILAAFLVSCKEEGPCGPSNCPGCCGGGICYPNPDPFACGKGGGPCTVCDTPPNGTATCVDGACGYVCLPGYGDCGGLATTCESKAADWCDQTVNAEGITCSKANGCDYDHCLAGWRDCDGDRANGCESTDPVCPTVVAVFPTSTSHYSNLVQDSLHLYIGFKSEGAHVIQQIPKSGEPATTLVTGEPDEIRHLSLSGDALYWHSHSDSSFTSFIRSYQLSSGALSTVLSRGRQIQALTVEADAYWFAEHWTVGMYDSCGYSTSFPTPFRSAHYCAQIFRVPMAGGAPEPIATDLAGVLVASSGCAYWSDATNVRIYCPNLPFGDDKPAVLAAGGAGEILPDGNFVYLVRPQGIYAVSSSSPSYLVTDEKVLTATLDSSHLYYTVLDQYPYDYRGNGVRKLPKSGGPSNPSTLISDSRFVGNLVVDQEYVYWRLGRQLVKVPK